jgi:hypothetical protein
LARQLTRQAYKDAWRRIGVIISDWHLDIWSARSEEERDALIEAHARAQYEGYQKGIVVCQVCDKLLSED